MIVTPATKLFAVVGDPVAHSLSPLIHNRWMTEAGIDAVYAALHLKSDHAGNDLRAIGRAGFSGLNVTLPHKLAALDAATSCSPAAKLIGAANTLAHDGAAGWVAHNTDLDGFAIALDRSLGGGTAGAKLKGRRVVLIGAGGAARAAAVHLAALGVSLAILNRSKGKAQALAAELAPAAEVHELSALEAVASEADVIVNSASLGHAGGELPPLPSGGGRAFLDMSYGKAAQSTLAMAAAAGWTPHDGLRMLVGQAAAAFRIWFGVSPDMDGALRACELELKARR